MRHFILDHDKSFLDLKIFPQTHASQKIWQTTMRAVIVHSKNGSNIPVICQFARDYFGHTW